MKPDPEHARRIRAALSGGVWVGRKLLASFANVPERAIRLFAENTGEVISSQSGYKLRDYATDDELLSSARDLESRARHLNERATELRAEYARRAGAYLEAANGDLFDPGAFIDASYEAVRDREMSA